MGSRNLRNNAESAAPPKGHSSSSHGPGWRRSRRLQVRRGSSLLHGRSHRRQLCSPRRGGPILQLVTVEISEHQAGRLSAVTHREGNKSSGSSTVSPPACSSRRRCSRSLSWFLQWLSSFHMFLNNLLLRQAAKASTVSKSGPVRFPTALESVIQPV